MQGKGTSPCETDPKASIGEQDRRAGVEPAWARRRGKNGSELGKAWREKTPSPSNCYRCCPVMCAIWAASSDLSSCQPESVEGKIVFDVSDDLVNDQIGDSLKAHRSSPSGECLSDTSHPLSSSLPQSGHLRFPARFRLASDEGPYQPQNLQFVGSVVILLHRSVLLLLEAGEQTIPGGEKPAPLPGLFVR